MAQGVRLLVLVALVLFLALGDTPDRTRFWVAFFDFGHAPLCGVFALVVRASIARRAVSELRADLYAFAAAVALAFATESVQVFQATRDASAEDLARDVAGAAAFLIAARAFRRNPKRPARAPVIRARRTAALGVAAVLMAASGAELVRTLALYVERARAFPTLFQLDGSWWERELITGQNSRLGYSGDAGGKGSAGLARLDLRPGRYPGLSFREPYPDWRGYEQFVLEVFSEMDEPLPLGIRVHDAAHDHAYTDRFNRQLIVRPGHNRFSIRLEEIRRAPRRREIDLANIRSIIIFAAGLKKPARLYLGPLRLE